MAKKIVFILLFVVAVGARHAVPLQGLAFADSYTQDGKPCPPECVSDSMEIITYYPSPYGYYEELRGDKIIVGDTDNSRIDETHLPPSGTLTFEPKSYAEITNTGTSYEGAIYYDSFDHEFKYYDKNSSWQPLVGGGGDYWKPSTASGGSDNIYYTQSGNVGIGVGESDTIGAKLQIDMSATAKGLIVKSPSLVQTFIGGAGQTYRVPPNITKLRITAYGEKGGGSVGGYGGKTVATISVAPQETLNVCVNCGGGEGGPYGGAGGGGASYVSRASNYLIVAGGGGGAGGPGGGGPGCHAAGTGYGGGGGGGGAGDGGGSTGTGSGRGGSGGTQTVGGGGAGGDIDTSNGLYAGGGAGNAGSGSTGGRGGSGAYCSCGCNGGGGGGGGGGYFGGGGGGGAAAGSYYRQAGGGGGGGSNYAIGSAINVSMLNGDNPGSGKVIIEPFVAGSIITPTSVIEWQDDWGTVLGVITTDGKVGMGTASPNAYLDIASGKTTLADAWSTRSSLRFKENLYPIDNALTKFTSLQGVYFDYKDTHKHSLGLVAEDVGRVFPELVTYEPDGTNAIALDYDKLSAVTIEAVKEQQKEIEELKILLKEQKESGRNQQKEIELLKAKEKRANIE